MNKFLTNLGIVLGLLAYAFAGLIYMHTTFATNSEAAQESNRVGRLEQDVRDGIQALRQDIKEVDKKLDRVIRERSR